MHEGNAQMKPAHVSCISLNFKVRSTISAVMSMANEREYPVLQVQKELWVSTSSSWMKLNVPAVVGIKNTEDLHKENLTFLN
jgi:hypothetical protein